MNYLLENLFLDQIGQEHHQEGILIVLGTVVSLDVHGRRHMTTISLQNRI